MARAARKRGAAQVSGKVRFQRLGASHGLRSLHPRFGIMKKGELKNLLRRRTADKLYDLARSTGRMPARLPLSEGPEFARESARRSGRGSEKHGPSRLPPR